MAELQLTGIGKTYAGGGTVLRGIDLHIPSGELVVFVGPSGCGKTTLLRMIAGLEEISAGDLCIDGERVNDLPPSQRGIAMVFQSYALYPHMTVYDNMAFALKIARKRRAEIDAAVRRAAGMLRLTAYLDRLPKELSGGQRQRVAIGRAILRNPKVYLFDEPLSNLDAALRGATRLQIAELKARMPDRTMIYVTHDQVEAMTLADRIVVLAEQGVAQVGAPLELYERPQSEFVAQFIGAPAMNLLSGRLARAGEGAVVALAGQSVQTDVLAAPALAGEAVRLGIRPEDLRLAGPGDPVVYAGRVAHVEALGEVTLLYLEAPEAADESGYVIAKLPGIFTPTRGETVHLTAPAAKMHLFHRGKRV
ncbi:MAG: ABC transporter ATP-binding protein [Rhodobacterales bacterium]|nr:MAG: ABC transporter ATP-binding protein [Rhodobacterales bacterium]PIE09230.1 MAG: ABC transporter ATP-binding protein [Rhodobacterales bacterium]